jgi:hypothetical protein
MMSKLFEVRDYKTFIPVIATEMTPDRAPVIDRWLLRRAGYGNFRRLFLVTRLDGTGMALYDPKSWPNRTMRGAHLYIEKHWDSLPSSAVVDARVEFGETDVPVESERHQAEQEIDTEQEKEENSPIK